MSERVIPIDIGVVPEAATAGPVLLQSAQSTFLIFNAMKRDLGVDGYVDAGRAICEFPGCRITKFGYPNDEAWSAIPRTHGLSYDVCEVADSEWDEETVALNRHRFPDVAMRKKRHFLIPFHDSSFECIAEDIRCQTSDEPIEVILGRLAAHIASE